MRTLFLIMAFLCLYCTVQAQDLIITNNNDSIPCKIISIKNSRVTYRTGVNRSMPESDVKSVLYNVSVAPAQKKISFNRPDFKRLQIGFNAGLGYLTARTASGLPSDMRKHIDGLRNGGNFEANAVYFISRRIGLGVMYHRFITSNTSNIAIDTAPDRYMTITTTDDITSQFIGASIWYRVPPEFKKVTYMVNFSLGYFSYFNNAMAIIPMEITASTMGIYFGFDTDYAITPSVSVYGHIGLFSASTDKAEVKLPTGQKATLRPDEKESFSRANIGAGIRFHLL